MQLNILGILNQMRRKHWVEKEVGRVRDRLVHTVGKVQSLKEVNEKQCFQRTKLFHIVNQIFSFPYTFN